MKKLALAFSSKDRVELSEQSSERLFNSPQYLDVFWNDGSATEEGKAFHQLHRWHTKQRTRVTGGPDRAIVFALTQMLAGDYTHVALLENDVLVDYDWLDSTMALFDYSKTEGLPVGAASARSYRDRILIQRDRYAVCHNVGAGHIVLTREAAKLVLNTYRNGFWHENRSVFSQLCQVDIGKFAAFGFNPQPITADWSWDTILAAHGYATVALTPSKAAMIGQDIPLEQQGLELTQAPVQERLDDLMFERYRESLLNIQEGRLTLPKVDHNVRFNNSVLIFPHQVGKHRGRYSGQWKTKWNQGFGPFAYIAQTECSLVIPLFGHAAFHVSAGKVAIRDSATGFSTDLDLTGHDDQMTAIPVPREMQHGRIEIKFSPGAVFHAIETTREQPEWDVPFDYNTLPETV